MIIWRFPARHVGTPSYHPPFRTMDFSMIFPKASSVLGLHPWLYGWRMGDGTRCDPTWSNHPWDSMGHFFNFRSAHHVVWSWKQNIVRTSNTCNTSETWQTKKNNHIERSGTIECKQTIKIKSKRMLTLRFGKTTGGEWPISVSSHFKMDLGQRGQRPREIQSLPVFAPPPKKRSETSKNIQQAQQTVSALMGLWDLMGQWIQSLLVQLSTFVATFSIGRSILRA